MRNFLVSNFSALTTRPDKGQLVESAIFANLNVRLETLAKLNFWRTRGGAEVDFVLRTGQEVIPIEVKFSSMIKPKLPAGFCSFLDSYQPNQAIILTGGG